MDLHQVFGPAADRIPVKQFGILSALCLILSPVFATAEYRVFLLNISKVNAEGQAPSGQDLRLVESTLDPEQYRQYNYVAPDERITYTDTWRCYGRTDGFRAHCPNPKSTLPEADNDTPNDTP